MNLCDLKNIISKGKILILGLGNRLRGDDAFGSILAEKLKIIESENIKVIDCQEVPENYLEKIISFRPECIIFLDTIVNMQGEGPFLLDENALKGNYNISTHGSSLNLIIKYLRNSNCNPEFKLLALKAKKIKLGTTVSDYIIKKIDEILKAFQDAKNQINKKS